MHENPVTSPFVIASQVFSIKLLSKNITSIFELLSENLEKYHTTAKI